MSMPDKPTSAAKQRRWAQAARVVRPGFVPVAGAGLATVRVLHSANIQSSWAGNYYGSEYYCLERDVPQARIVLPSLRLQQGANVPKHVASTSGNPKTELNRMSANQC